METQHPQDAESSALMDMERKETHLNRLRRQLLLLYEVGNLMRITLKLDEVVYLIVSAVTSHEGLGFNRAILFLIDDARTMIRGVFGIGPKDPKESAAIWKGIGEQKLQLKSFIDIYRRAHGNIDVDLNNVVEKVVLPMNDSGGIIAKVAMTGAPAVILDDNPVASSDIALAQFSIGQFAAVPVRGKNEILGTLLVDNITTKKPIKKDDVLTLSMLADHAGLAIENAKMYNQALENSQKDSLTHLWNHGHFQQLLTQAIDIARLQNQPLSLILFDVDDFKKFNDHLGHQQGDHALETIAQILRNVLRKNDYVARYGGEEFAVIFRGSTKKEALQLADKLRMEISNGTQGMFHSELIKKITISVGVATFPEDAEDREKLIFCADAALYEAKRAGKDQTKVYQASAS